MDKKSISQRLLKLRGTTPRRQVATACNIKVSALTNYELGIRIPRDDVKSGLRLITANRWSLFFLSEIITISDKTKRRIYDERKHLLPGCGKGPRCHDA